MTEPIYEYRKGEGWVVSTFFSVEMIDRLGNHIRLEYREPELGEHFFFGFGTRNSHRDVSHVKRFGFQAFAQWDKYWEYRPDVTVVLVPL